MSNCDSLKSYYAGWSTGNGQIPRDIFADNFHFKGPMEETNDINMFAGMLEQFSAVVDNVEFTNKIKDGNKAVATYTITTKLPMSPMHCAEVFTFNDEGKIERIDFFFDPREFEKVMAAQA